MPLNNFRLRLFGLLRRLRIQQRPQLRLRALARLNQDAAQNAEFPISFFHQEGELVPVAHAFRGYFPEEMQR